MFHFLKHNDFWEAVKEHELWLYLARQDIRLRYRRSKIGPFWITLSMTVFIVTLGVVYSKLFNVDIKEYLPFLASGFIIWTFISGMLTEMPNLFVDNAGYIKDIKMNPISIVFRMATRHLIILGHNIVIMIGVYFYFEINPGYSIILLLPSTVIVMMNLISIGIALSVIGVRFRDVAPMTQSVVQILFFITPLMWFPRLLSVDSWIVIANPFAHFLDIMRSPILGQQPELHSWFVSVITLSIFSFISLIVYKNKSHNIPHWV